MKYSLLIVEPSPSEQTKINEMLSKEFANTIFVSNEQDAIIEVQKKSPDLILLDMEEVPQACSPIEQLRENKLTRNIPVLLFTSINNETPTPECLYYGNTDFISKPFRKKELILRITHQLSLVKAQQIIKKQNERLKQTIEFKDKLYSVIAHDLRAPIGTIKMINATIERKKNQITDPEIRQLFEMNSETTEEAFNLLENLLRWSRNQNGKTKVMPTLFNLKNTARQIISLFTAIASTKNIKLYNHITQDISVYADEDMIKTILRNLISNAIKFTYPGGQIDMNIDTTTNMAILSIKDNGQGIAPENQTDLLKNTTSVISYGTRNEKGSGLGLVLCREFVKANQGKLWFTSTEGKGSTFYFSIPKTPVN